MRPSRAPVFGDKTRAVEEAVLRERDQPASLTSLLVELHRLLGPLGTQTLDSLAKQLDLPAADLHRLAQALRLDESASPVARLGLCSNGPCAVRSGIEVERILQEKNVAFTRLRCQGSCDLGPIACYHSGPPLAISAARARSLAKADPAQWEDLLSVEKPVHAFKTEQRVAFANLFAKGSHQIATARRHGVYSPVETALQGTRESLLAVIEESGLVDDDKTICAPRWRAVANASASSRVLLVNGTEHEPGTFHHRLLLERDPHLVVAGTILAAFAVDAREAYLCIRGEYELATERLRSALEEASRAGMIGERLAGSDFSLRIHLRLTPSIYLTGEAAKLTDILEGKLPFGEHHRAAVEQSGLFGYPTLVQSAQTLAKVGPIVEKGPAWYRDLGVGAGQGVTVVSLTGDLKRPGGYEVPRGTPVRVLVEDLGGGPLQGKSIIALQVGGCSGPYLPYDDRRDLPFDDLCKEQINVSTGDGAVMAISEKACLYELARRETDFFAREINDHCAGCRLLNALGEAVEQWGIDPTNAARVTRLVNEIQDASGCLLSRRAIVPVESLLRHFPQAATQHAAGECTCAKKKN